MEMIRAGQQLSLRGVSAVSSPILPCSRGASQAVPDLPEEGPQGSGDATPGFEGKRMGGGPKGAPATVGGIQGRRRCRIARRMKRWRTS
jgi:hypothetical protein